MRLVLLFAGVLLVSTQSTSPKSEAQTMSALNPFSRCAAVTGLLAKNLSNDDVRERHQSGFEAHYKFSALFFLNEAAHVADIRREEKAILENLNADPSHAKFVVDLADECEVHSVLALQNFLACLGNESPSEERKLACAKRAVGL